MSPIKKKLLVACALLVVAVGYLAYAGMKTGWVYYMEVDKFLADTQVQSQRVRLHGKVDIDGFSVDKLDASFNLLGKSGKVAITYHGVIPEMFQAGRDVVVEGKLQPTGTFKADLLMTKCASKYEPNSPHSNAAESKESK
jgi:cytochrome c-type biogenesis protein CcmE